MQKLRAEKGITLIALVITIIVMLILVGVSVTVALNGGLFKTANQAKENTATERDKELNLSDGKVEINGEWYDSIDEYVNGSGNGTGVEVTLPTGWTVTTKPETWTSERVTAIKEMATGNIVALPEGYSISEVAEEQTVDGGLVVTDGTNEFVWIPATGFSETYSSGTDCSEPMTVSLDTQNDLNKYYGTKENGTNYYTLETDFAYSTHYAEMVTSVNDYGGFYIGRYETTIDGTSIGSKEGATVLTANETLKEGTNANNNNNAYYYRWWGLYNAQRNSNVLGNGSTVQTNMIWGQQWDAMITYFGDKDYSNTTVKTLATSGKQNAGQAKYTYNEEEISDEICNIYDLRGNIFDWTAEGYNTSNRVFRGGHYLYNFLPASALNRNFGPGETSSIYGSRITLYIK